MDKKVKMLQDWVIETSNNIRKLDGEWYRNFARYEEAGLDDKAREVYLSRRTSEKEFLKWAYDELGLNRNDEVNKAYQYCFPKGVDDTNYMM